jgi:hypothetical protein
MREELASWTGAIIPLMMIILAACGIAVFIASFHTTITDLSILESQPCHTIEISDKFTSVVGSGFSSGTKYFITSNNTTCNLLISTPEEIQKFRNINKTVNVKTYKNYAGFCDYVLIGGILRSGRE